MFNDAFSHMELMELLRPHMGQSAWPGIDDPDAPARARKAAKATGIWKTIGDTIDRVPTHTGMPWSAVKHCLETGNQKTFGQHFWSDLSAGTHAAALAVWLKHPQASLDRLEDYLVAWCEMHDWIHPSHQRDVNLGADLTSAHIAAMLSEYWWVFRNELHTEVRRRVAENVEERFLKPAVDHHRFNWWMTGTNNWNHVVLSCLITTALYQYENPYTLAAYIHPLIENLKFGLKGYTADGGCTEGPDYWSYGFQHFLKAAIVLQHRTGGAVNIVQGHPHIEKIARYPLSSYIDGIVRMCWADSYHAPMSYLDAEYVNRFFKLPELYSLCRRNASGWSDGGMSIQALLAARKMPKGTTAALHADAILPDLGTCKAYAADTKKPVAMAITAGNNGVNHNHNDIGSFIYYRDGVCFVTDPGFPLYTAQHFSPARYTKFHCRSWGHSVPFIDGQEQKEGAQHYGVLTCEGFGASGEKRAVVDMTHAYDIKHLKTLVRTLVLAPHGALTVTDDYTFSRAPKKLEEAFITYEPARVAKNGRSVTIGRGRTEVVLESVGMPGRFEATVLEKESAEGRGQGTITRIRFMPATLGKSVRLEFRIA